MIHIYRMKNVAKLVGVTVSECFLVACKEGKQVVAKRYHLLVLQWHAFTGVLLCQ